MEPLINSDNFVLHEHQKNVIRIQMKLAAEPILGVPYRSAQTMEEFTDKVGKWDNLAELPRTLDAPGLLHGICRKVGLRFPETLQEQFNFTIAAEVPHMADFVFLGYAKDINRVYHAGMVFDQDLIVETNALRADSKYESGRVVLHPRLLWDRHDDFLGYRSHPKLL